jgi:hypothetical protein
MSSYAPLLTNPLWQKWKPDAIVFNNTSAYGTPSYYVQTVFGSNCPETVLPLELPTLSGTGIFAVAGRKETTGEIILKLVNSSNQPEPLGIGHISGSLSWMRRGRRQPENISSHRRKLGDR